MGVDGDIAPPSPTRALAIGKAAGTLLAVVLGAVSAYRTADAEAKAHAKEQSQVVKDKAEAGYQVLLHAVTSLEARVLTLEQAARQLQVSAAQPRRGPRPLRRTPTVAVGSPPPIPRDLDKAKQMVGGHGDPATVQPASPHD